MKQRPYQALGTQFLVDTGRAVLADDPGIGKTNQCLLAARGRTLVLSPAMLSDVWDQEITDWESQLDVDAEFSWMSYSGLCKRVSPEPGKPASKVVPFPRDGLLTKWDTIICDEAHYLKNRGTNWTKVVATKLKSDRLYLATGTPMPNWGHEIFMFLRLLHPGDKRFTNYWAWINEWFNTWKPPWGGTQIRGLHRGVTWEEAAQEWGLTGRWLRREMDDVLSDLPPMVEQTIKVQMSPAQARVYKGLKEDYSATLPISGEEMVVWNDGAKHAKLLQCSTGLESLAEGETGSAKLTALEELMKERTRPTLIFCIYKASAEAAAKRLMKQGHSVGVVSSAYSMEDRKATVRAFQAGDLDVIVGTIGTLSEGVTLTQADTCVFLERSPRPVSNFQARRRIRRFGQERPTLAIDLVTEDSVDEKLSKLLAEKETDQNLALTGFQLAQLL